MRTTKGLLAVAATALALMGFAPSAIAATDGVVRDVTPNGIIPANTELHAVGWANFTSVIPGGSFNCHVTAIIKMTGTEGKTGDITVFKRLEPFACTFIFPFNGCTLTASSADNLPWHVTVTPPSGTTAGDLDVTPHEESLPIRITNTFSGALCPIAGTSSITASGLTLSPLKTGTSAVTNTSGRLTAGTIGTAGVNDPIAGFELSGSAFLDKPNEGGSEEVRITGELELTSATHRCTWKIAAS